MLLVQADSLTRKNFRTNLGVFVDFNRVRGSTLLLSTSLSPGIREGEGRWMESILFPNIQLGGPSSITSFRGENNLFFLAISPCHYTGVQRPTLVRIQNK